MKCVKTASAADLVASLVVVRDLVIRELGRMAILDAADALLSAARQGRLIVISR